MILNCLTLLSINLVALIIYGGKMNIKKLLSIKFILLSFIIFTLSCSPQNKENKDFKTGFIKVKNIPVYYEVYGNSSKSIILVHGWSCNTKFFKEQIKVLSPSYKVVLIDLPGHGKSGAPENVDYSLDLFSDAVFELSQYLKLKKPVLAGHSMGYSIIRKTILKYGEKNFSALINIDGAHFIYPKNKRALKMYKAMVLNYVKGFENEDKNKRSFSKKFIIAMIHPSVSKEDRSFIVNQMLKTKKSVAFSAMQNMMLKNEPFWRDKAQTNLPVLAIYSEGSHSQLKNNETFLKALYPKLQYHYLKRTGHFYNYVQPQKFNQMLVAFLNQL